MKEQCRRMEQDWVNGTGVVFILTGPQQRPASFPRFHHAVYSIHGTALRTRTGFIILKEKVFFSFFPIPVHGPSFMKILSQLLVYDEKSFYLWPAQVCQGEYQYVI